MKRYLTKQQTTKTKKMSEPVQTQTQHQNLIMPSDIIYRGVSYRHDEEAERNVDDDIFIREVMNDYFNRIINVDDLDKKVVLAVELFEWINESASIQQNLLAPKNADLFNELNELMTYLDVLIDNPANAAAIQAIVGYQAAKAEIQFFVARGQILVQPAEFDRNLIDNYIISIVNVEDDEMKVNIALELFTWLDDYYPIRQALFASENDDLFEDFNWLLKELACIPAYTAALEANYNHQLTDSEIKNFVSCWQAVLKERERQRNLQLDEDVAAEKAYAAKYCCRCDEALQEDDIAYGNHYCHHCTLAKIDAEFS
jgi:hypothetical protein